MLGAMKYHGWSRSKNNLNYTKHMTTLIKQIVVLLFISALVAVAGLGCQTAHGFGKDMQNAGEGIQKGTD
jgi:predicted small secreted protein